MPPYIAIKPCHSRGRTPFPDDTMFSVNPEGKEDQNVRLRAVLVAVVEAAGATLDNLLLRDGDDVGGDVVELRTVSGMMRIFGGEDLTYAQALEQVFGLLVDVERTRLAVLSEVESRDLGNVLILAFTLLFLELEGNTTDGTTLNTLHPT